MCFKATASDDGALAEGGLSAMSFRCVEPEDFLKGGINLGGLPAGDAITAKSNGAVFAGKDLKKGSKVSVTYYQPMGNNNEDFRPPKPMSDADKLKFALLAAGIVDMPKIEMPKMPELPKMPKLPEVPKLPNGCPDLSVKAPKLPGLPKPGDISGGLPGAGAKLPGGMEMPEFKNPFAVDYEPEKQLLPRFSPKLAVSSFAGDSKKVTPCMMAIKLTGAAQLVAGAAAVTLALF